MSEVKINPDPIAAQVLKSIAVEQAFRQYHSHAPLHCTYRQRENHNDAVK